MPRTTRLTPALTAAIAALVEKGADPGSAGEAVGVSRATVNEWLRRGEDRDDRDNGPAFATFATEVRAAEARVLASVVEAWTAAAVGGDWRAGAAWAARRFPDAWGERRQVSVGVSAEEPLTLSRLGEMMKAEE